MAINLSISSLGDKFVDLRDSLPGDAYNWSWIRPLSQVNYLVIHHSATLNTQTPQEIAEYHINNNGWGGIGYHFLISKEGVVYYVGDISTARANVANLNEQVIGICLIGSFTEGRTPTEDQYDSAHKLCEFLINYPALPNVKSWETVKPHKSLPGQVTVCPGEDESWLSKIISPKEIIFNQAPIQSQEVLNLKSQVDSLQTTLATINQQVIFLQEALQEKDLQIKNLTQTSPPEKNKPTQFLYIALATAIFIDFILSAFIILYTYTSKV